MRILLSNDDGVHAPGIQTLAKALREFADVQVVAPDRNRSGASNSLTLESSLRTFTFDNGDIAVQMGTPTDCVYLGVNALMRPRPDIVVSGINAGPNLGDDVIYSGTVAAAMEGRHLGFPALAVSLKIYFTSLSGSDSDAFYTYYDFVLYDASRTGKSFHRRARITAGSAGEY